MLRCWAEARRSATYTHQPNQSSVTSDDVSRASYGGTSHDATGWTCNAAQSRKRQVMRLTWRCSRSRPSRDRRCSPGARFINLCLKGLNIGPRPPYWAAPSAGGPILTAPAAPLQRLRRGGRCELPQEASYRFGSDSVDVHLIRRPDSACACTFDRDA